MIPRAVKVKSGNCSRFQFTILQQQKRDSLHTPFLTISVNLKLNNSLPYISKQTNKQINHFYSERSLVELYVPKYGPTCEFLQFK